MCIAGRRFNHDRVMRARAPVGRQPFRLFLFPTSTDRLVLRERVFVIEVFWVKVIWPQWLVATLLGCADLGFP